jgi:hypothetical protein
MSKWPRFILNFGNSISYLKDQESDDGNGRAHSSSLKQQSLKKKCLALIYGRIQFKKFIATSYPRKQAFQKNEKFSFIKFKNVRNYDFHSTPNRW